MAVSAPAVSIYFGNTFAMVRCNFIRSASGWLCFYTSWRTPRKECSSSERNCWCRGAPTSCWIGAFERMLLGWYEMVFPCLPVSLSQSPVSCYRFCMTEGFTRQITVIELVFLSKLEGNHGRPRNKPMWPLGVFILPGLHLSLYHGIWSNDYSTHKQQQTSSKGERDHPRKLVSSFSRG